MPRFKKLDPSEVVVGRGLARISCEPYRKALQSGEAGAIDLEPGDRPGTVKRLLREAAKEMGLRVRSSWKDETQQTLLWKKSAETSSNGSARRK